MPEELEAEQPFAWPPLGPQAAPSTVLAPSGLFPRRQLPGSKRMAFPALPEASWLPHLEAGLRTFHLAMKVLPARPVNEGQELDFCNPEP